jgi:hypothetical protein
MHEMLNFSISYPDLIKKIILWIPLKKQFGGERRPKDKMILKKTLIYTLTLKCP